MNDYPRTIEDGFKQSEEEELLISMVSDEVMEQAAGGKPCPPAHPGTGVATICVRDPSIP